MIAAPQLPALVRFEATRLARSRPFAIGLALFVCSEAALRILALMGRIDSSNDEFRWLYFLALIPVLRFGLIADRATSFDEALATNGVPPWRYLGAKLSAAAITLVAFTLVSSAAAILVGGVPPVMVGWAAGHGVLVAWLFAPGAFLVESVSEIRMPVAVVYILVFVAMLVLYRSGLFVDMANLTGLLGRSAADLRRLLVTDLTFATPLLVLGGWLTVVRRLARRGQPSSSVTTPPTGT